MFVSKVPLEVVGSIGTLLEVTPPSWSSSEGLGNLEGEQMSVTGRSASLESESTISSGSESLSR